jgi:5-aminopentanamidase
MFRSRLPRTAPRVERRRCTIFTVGSPGEELHVTVVELPATWGEPERALAAVDALLASGARTDLVLLPEASLTGYVSPEGEVDPTAFAEERGGPTSRALGELAARHAAHVVGPLVLRERGASRERDHFYNAMVAFDPEGREVFTYKKRHPWFPETWARPGAAEAPVVEIRGVAVTIATCFDVHFLDDDAAATLARSDLLLFPSAWVDEDEDGRAAILAAVAVRHAVFVANANWGPGEVCLPGQGGSSIFDPSGSALASVGPGGGRADAVVRGREPAPNASLRAGRAGGVGSR